MSTPSSRPMGRDRRTQLALGATALGLAAAAVAAGPATSPAAGGPQLAESPDISVTNAKAHLDDLQQIADDNGGRRSNGTSGYRASVDWAKAKFEAAGYTVTVQEFTTGTLGTTKSWNVIAEWPHGDPEHVVMAGAHLDSVSAGAGINDNGTGTAGIVETALAYAASGKTPKNRLRFALWGAEEIGLLGSKYYSAQLSQAEKDKLELYLNFDMIGSPNPGYFVYDDNAAGNGARDDLTAYFDGQGIPWEYIDVQGRSDHASFRAAGIPTAGTFTGAEAKKTSAQATKWGGTANAPFDPCYHQSCDGIQNLNLTAFDDNIDAIGHMIWLYSDKDYGTTPPPTGGNLVKNGGFESGAVNWTGTTSVITNSTSKPAHAGTWQAWLGGNGRTSTENLTQTVTIPGAATSASLSFWLRIDTAENTTSTAYDTLKVQVVGGTTTSTRATYSNLDKSASYVQKTLDLSAYKGKTVTLKLLLSEDDSLQTSFVVDDVALATQ